MAREMKEEIFSRGSHRRQERRLLTASDSQSLIMAGNITGTCLETPGTRLQSTPLDGPEPYLARK
ncbi:hypothetical protein J6590_020298 [Homalodisca vitripennis]|nr:hypothetical protein J6590_020298 [Homalodisca vitripennis]